MYIWIKLAHQYQLSVFLMIISSSDHFSLQLFFFFFLWYIYLYCKKKEKNILYCKLTVFFVLFYQDVENLKQVTTNKKENIASSRLGKRIDSLLDKVDVTLFDLEKDVSELPFGKIDLDE